MWFFLFSSPRKIRGWGRGLLRPTELRGAKVGGKPGELVRLLGRRCLKIIERPAELARGQEGRGLHVCLLPLILPC